MPEGECRARAGKVRVVRFGDGAPVDPMVRRARPSDSAVHRNGRSQAMPATSSEPRPDSASPTCGADRSRRPHRSLRVMVAGTIAGLTMGLFAFTVMSAMPSEAAAQSGDITSGKGETGKTEAVDKRNWTADDHARFKHRSRDNDALYDSIANLSTPSSQKVLPWLFSLILGALVLFVGLKPSFRNRYEG